MPSAVLLVRHALPMISASMPPGEWGLSPSGRDEAAAIGTRIATLDIADRAAVVASSERKAMETAELLGLGQVHVDHLVGEVEKPWYDDPEEHRRAAHQYLAGNPLSGWEPRRSAISRFATAVENVTDDLAVVVSHGTVMSLWLDDSLPAFDPVRYWSELQMPDAWLIDLGQARLKRVATVS